MAITDHIDSDKRSPDNSLSSISAQQLRNGVFAYTSIHAPRGLNERIYHVWQLNGQQIDKVALDINGGREAGYRAWSHKVNFPENSVGRWQIRVVTEANQVIGVLRFRVDDQAGRSSPKQDRKPDSDSRSSSNSEPGADASSKSNPGPDSSGVESSTPTPETPIETNPEPLPETAPETGKAPASAVPTTPDGAMKAQLMQLVE